MWMLAMSPSHPPRRHRSYTIWTRGAQWCTPAMPDTEITIRITHKGVPEWAQALIPRLRRQGYRSIWSTYSDHVIVWGTDESPGIPDVSDNLTREEIDHRTCEGDTPRHRRWHISRNLCVKNDSSDA